MSAQIPTILSIEDWDVKALKFFPAKPSNGGGKNVNFISTQTSKPALINLPESVQYGINDYLNPNTQMRDGKFKMSMKIEDTTTIEKLSALKDVLIDAAVQNSQSWFGKQMKRDIAEFNLKFPLDYPNISATDKTPDLSKAPYLKLSVPNFPDSGWDIQVYDENRVRLFPSDGVDSPVELLPKGSRVSTCVKCSSIWVVDGKWGVSLKLVQCMIYPHESFDYKSQCMIPSPMSAHIPEPAAPVVKAPVITKPEPVVIAEPEPVVEEAEPEPVKAPVVIAEPEPEPVVEEAEPVAAVVKKTVKKIIKAKV